MIRTPALGLALAAAAVSLAAAPGLASAQTVCTPPRAMILFDRSTSMHVDLIGGHTKWDLATAAVKDVVGTYDHKIEFGLDLFPATALTCSAGTVAVAPALDAGARIGAALQGPVRNMFTPIGAALKGMLSEPSLSVANRPKRYVVLVTDGHEDCPVDSDEQSQRQVVETVNALRAQGVITYVVGFGQPSNGDGVDALLLNRLAVAGGTAIGGCNDDGSDPAAGDLCYFQADDYDALVASLETIALDVANETCDGMDNDCDGHVDEGCDCVDGTLRACGQLEGECRQGTQTCANGAWGACDGEVAPAAEVCDGVDNDCDGTTDDGCECKPGETRSCGSGRIGVCKPGTQTCSDAGQWSTCKGGVTPSLERCDGLDNDCDGWADNAMEGNSVGLCGKGAACSAGKCVSTTDYLAGGGCQLSEHASGGAAAGLLLLAALLLLRARAARR